MISNPKTKARLKIYLIIGNIALCSILVFLIAYWLISIRADHIAISTELGQYRSYSMNDLPTDNNEIEADYVGTIYPAMLNQEGINDPRISNITAKETNDNPNLLGTGKKGANIVKPRISILITNLGTDERLTKLALSLPPQCALGFVNYKHNSKLSASLLAVKNHEVYLSLPFQKMLREQGKYSALDVISDSYVSCRGLYSDSERIYANEAASLEIISKQLNDKNLILILGKKINNNLVSSNSNNIITANIIITDQRENKESILLALNNLVKQAKNDGFALGSARGSISTIETIRDWIPTLDKENIHLVPVSELLSEYNS